MTTSGVCMPPLGKCMKRRGSAREVSDFIRHSSFQTIDRGSVLELVFLVVARWHGPTVMTRMSEIHNERGGRSSSGKLVMSIALAINEHGEAARNPYPYPLDTSLAINCDAKTFTLILRIHELVSPGRKPTFWGTGHDGSFDTTMFASAKSGEPASLRTVARPCPPIGPSAKNDARKKLAGSGKSSHTSSFTFNPAVPCFTPGR